MRDIPSSVCLGLLLVLVLSAGCSGNPGPKAVQKADLKVVFTNRMPHTMDVNATIHSATNEVAWKESKSLTADETVTAGQASLPFGDYTFVADAHSIQCHQGPFHVDATTAGWQVTVNPDGSVTCPVASK